MRKYTTMQGDMWDAISLHVYGTEKLMHLLIEANHEHRNTATPPFSRRIVSCGCLMYRRVKGWGGRLGGLGDFKKIS